MNKSDKKKNFHFILGLIIPLLFLTVSLYTINDYGETTDEKFDQHIGEFYYNDWNKKGIKGLEERFIPLQRNYGPFFDVIVVASNDLLHKKTNFIKNPVGGYHFPVIIISALTIWVVFMFSYFNWGLVPALLASLTLAIMPRFIGDSQNNLKDTPLMTFFSITLLFYYLAEVRKKLIFYILAGLFLGIAYTIKPNALIIIPTISLWYFLKGDFLKNIKRLFVFNALSIVVAFFTILLVWPYYQYKTLNRFVETYLTFKNHVWDEYILYLGNFYRGHEVPWHYPIVIFGVTTPVFFLIFILIGLLLFLYFFRKNQKYKNTLLLLLFWILLPPMIQVLSKAPMYDGIRHFLLILPPLSILVGFTVWHVGIILQKLLINKRRYLFIFYLLFILLGYIQIFLDDIRLHPYQIVYFNQLTGGVKGAYSKFDLDYWGQSLKEAAEWVNNNLPAGSKIWLTIPFAHHFPIAGDRFSLSDQNPDYKVSLIRGMLKTWDTEEDYLHPKRKPIFSIKVDGGDILKIFKM